MDTLGIVVLLLVAIQMILGCTLMFTSVRKKVNHSRKYGFGVIALQTLVSTGFIIAGVIYLL